MAASNFHRRWLSQLRSPSVLAIVILLALTITLRLTHLERRVYWFDEVIHTIQSFGYYKGDLRQAVSTADTPQPLSTLEPFLAPNPDRPGLATVQVLSETEPQSTPVHYLLNRWWSDIFGPSVFSQRLLAAIFGLGLLPVTYWLAVEFQRLYPGTSSLFPWLATLFVALSPIQVLYSREIRLYSLWVLLSTASTAALLRAVRSQSRPGLSRLSWSLHGVLAVAAVYTFPLEWVSVFGRTLWLLVTKRSHWRGLLISQGAALLAFIPWGIAIQQNIHKMGNWREASTSLKDLVSGWFVGHSLFVIDWCPIAERRSGTFSLISGILLAIATGGLLLWLYRRRRAIFWLTLFVAIFPWLIWACQDVIKGGIRSSWGCLRYYLPGNVLFSVVFSVVFAEFLKIKGWRRGIVGLSLAVWVGAGLVSDVQIARSQTSRFAFSSNEWVKWGRAMGKTPNSIIAIPKDHNGAGVQTITASRYMSKTIEFVTVDDPTEKADLLRPYDTVYVISPKDEWKQRVNENSDWKLTQLSTELFSLSEARE
ncbi:MAG: hypothetical protein AAGA67_03155 [Cyanobacteria bacterium P01_F01_bin.153]